MAVAIKPSLLLLDEPTAGMSPEETFKTGEMVHRLNAERMTILVVEHDMTFIRQIARKITVMHLGDSLRAGHHRRDHPTRGRQPDLSGGIPWRLRC